MRVIIEESGGRTFEVKIDRCDKVEFLKCRIEEQHHHPESWQKLMYKGMTLDSRKKLEVYDIQDKSKIKMLVKKPPSRPSNRPAKRPNQNYKRTGHKKFMSPALKAIVTKF